MEWIKCSERMPEIGETVLIFDDEANQVVARRAWDFGKTQFEGDYYTYEAVWWMPLPPPPSE